MKVSIAVFSWKNVRNLPILRLARHKTGGAALFGEEAIPIKSAIKENKALEPELNHFIYFLYFSQLSRGFTWKHI